MSKGSKTFSLDLKLLAKIDKLVKMGKYPHASDFVGKALEIQIKNEEMLYGEL